MSTTDHNPLSREELLIRSITTLLSIVKLQTDEPSEPPKKKVKHHQFQLLLDRIALLFVREPAGEIYSVVVSHAFVEHCDYDKRESDDSGSSKHKGNNTITLYLCPNATTERTYDWKHTGEPTSKKLPAKFQQQWLETILRDGHLTVEQHTRHLAYLIQGLTKVDQSKIHTSQAFKDFRKYIYFSSCQKINKRLKKSVKHEKEVRSFLETLFEIDRTQAVASLPGRSQDEDSEPLQDEDSEPLQDEDSEPLQDEDSEPLQDEDSEPLQDEDSEPLQDEDSEPLQDEDSGLSQDEDWIREQAEVLGRTFTLIETRTAVKHIELDLRGIENLQKLIEDIVNPIMDMINEICQVYSTNVHPDKVTETAKNVHKHLDLLLEMMWLLRELLNSSPSLRRFLEVVPEGPALRKWLKKISQWEMVAHDIISPHIQKRLKTSPLSIYTIQPPPLRHPGSMATLDDTFAAIFENVDVRAKAARSLGELAKLERGHRRVSRGLWQLVYEWQYGAPKQKNRLLWEKSFAGTVHCESTIATIATIRRQGIESGTETQSEEFPMVEKEEEFQTVLSKSAMKEKKKEFAEKTEKIEKRKVFKELSKNIADGRPHIGVSKRCCFSCASYIKLLSEGKLSLGGTHGKCYPWSIPQHCCPDVRDDMLNLLKQTIEPILRKRIRSPSARSDSSAGSDAQLPKKNDDIRRYHKQSLADILGEYKKVSR